MSEGTEVPMEQIGQAMVGADKYGWVLPFEFISIFLLDYTFLGAAQISIYAGGITMMYIFAIQLVSKRTLQGLEEHVKGSRVLVGALAALIGFGTVMIVFFKNQLFDLMWQR